jgi:hypothetical protein
MNKVLVLSGNYRPNFRDMVLFRNSGKDAEKVWMAERNTRIIDQSRVDMRSTLHTKGVYRKEFGIRQRKDFLKEAA